MLQVKVNESVYELTQDGDETVFINNEVLNWDIIRTGSDSFHVILNDKSYEAEVENLDYETKSLSVKINGKSLNVNAKDNFDLLLEKLGMNKSKAGAIKELKAPMPGLILEVAVKPGDSVSKGDKLVILEAMKMENVLKAPADLTVKSVKIKKGENVEKAHILIVFE